MNTSWKKICTCKSHNIKQISNTKTEQCHITATRHCYRKTFCSYSYILVVYFTLQSVKFPASTIWGVQKLGLVGMVSYHCNVPNFKMFLTLPKFEWSCFSWPNFDLGCCNLLKYLQYMQIWMTLFQFVQMFLIVPKFEWSCFKLFPNMIEAVGICLNVSKCVQI